MKLLSLCALPALLLTAACGAHETAPNEVDPTQATAPAPARAPAKPVEFIGAIVSKKQKGLVPDFEAKISKLNVRSGQLVKAGEIVAELDTSSLENSYNEAKGQYDSARGMAGRAGAMYANVARKVKINERLARMGLGSRQAVMDSVAEAGGAGGDGGQAAGQMAAAKARMTEIKKQIETAKITAPFDGQVSVIKVREGETALRTGPILRVYDPQQMSVKFAVPRKLSTGIKIGSNIELVTKQDHITVPATVEKQFDAADAAVDFVVFEATIDPNFRTDGIRVGDNGYVRIAGAQR